MKPEIQENMETRTTEITEQNIIFDEVISAIESSIGITMIKTAENNYNILTEDNWDITVFLNESLFEGIININVNRNSENGSIRFATMTINSKRVIQESYNNIDTVIHHKYITDLFGDIFEEVKETNTSST